MGVESTQTGDFSHMIVFSQLKGHLQTPEIGKLPAKQLCIGMGQNWIPQSLDG